MHTVHAIRDVLAVVCHYVINTSGHEKDHFIVVLARMVDGTKLKPMVIFKRMTMPKDRVPPDLVVHVHLKSWMDEDGMYVWLRKVWGVRPGGMLRKKSLLVFDAFRAHLVDGVKSRSVKSRTRDMKTDLCVIPGGLTSQLVFRRLPQQAIQEPYENKNWTQRLMDEDAHTFTRGGNLKKPLISQVCTWVMESWIEISVRMAVKSFKKCCISNGTEDDILLEDNSDDGVSDSGIHADVMISSSDEEQGDDASDDTGGYKTSL